MTNRTSAFSLVTPALLLYLFLLVGPLCLLLHQSLFSAGPDGSKFTLEFYRALFSESFIRSLFDTFRISVIATCIATSLGFLMAYHLIRHSGRRMRNVWLNIIVSILFLSLLIRVYALLLTFSGGGFIGFAAALIGVSSTSRGLTEALVVMGLLNFTIPLVILSLLGPIENINPKLMDAAQTLGAPYWKAFLTIDTALAAPSLLSIAIVTFSLCMSAFLIPMILGRGFVQFVSNLIYVRFEEVFDPSAGAAMAVVMLLITLAIIYGVQRALRVRA